MLSVRQEAFPGTGGQEKQPPLKALGPTPRVTAGPPLLGLPSWASPTGIPLPGLPSRALGLQPRGVKRPPRSQGEALQGRSPNRAWCPKHQAKRELPVVQGKPEIGIFMQTNRSPWWLSW